MKKYLIFTFLILTGLLTTQCDKNNDVVFFSIKNDIALGLQADSAIEADPTQFPILKESENQAAYTYLRSMVNDIVTNGDVTHKTEFAWTDQIHIIKKDDVLNAFATPGGYIYVYTGLIKYLDNPDDLAGVIGHEIAHADQRHSMKQIQQQYGLSAAIGIITGGSSGELTKIIAGLTGQLASLKFSRNHETEADEYSVKYLSKTKYACNGAASFFAKLIKEEQSGGTPEFLSTHPNPDNRVENINKEATEIGCSTTVSSEKAAYESFRASL